MYTCGDVVSGEVQVERTQKARAVSITFKATCQISISGTPNRHLHSATIDLFSFATNLFTFSGTELSAFAEDGRTHVSFPFTFTFPWVVKSAPPLHATLPFPRNPHFEHLRGHPLPPTFHTRLAGAHQSITYSLSASLTTATLLHTHRAASLALPFTPPCPVPLPTPPPPPVSKTTDLARRHHRLDPRRNTGLRTRVRHLLAGPDPLRPAVTFAITASAPARLRAGHPLLPGVTVALTHLTRGAEVPAPPSVTLRAWRVRLEGVTRVRLPSGEGAEVSAEGVERAWEAVGRCDDGGPPVLLEDCGVLELGAVGGGGPLVVPEEVVPGFRSYGVAREYVLEVLLWVGCVGKVFEVIGARHEVEVLSVLGREENLVLGMGDQVEVRRDAVVEDGLEEPPAYAPPAYEP